MSMGAHDYSMEQPAPVSATEIKWAETLRHHAAHPDPISIHCAIPARMVEEVAAHIDALTARLAEAERVTEEQVERGAKVLEKTYGYTFAYCADLALRALTAARGGG